MRPLCILSAMNRTAWIAFALIALLPNEAQAAASGQESLDLLAEPSAWRGAEGAQKLSSRPAILWGSIIACRRAAASWANCSSSARRRAGFSAKASDSRTTEAP